MKSRALRDFPEAWEPCTRHDSVTDDDHQLEHLLAPEPMKLLRHDAIQIRLLLLLGQLPTY